MNFDLSKTLKLVIGGLTNPQETWTDYLGENPPWQRTLVELTAPLFVVSMVLNVLFSRMVGNFSPYTMGRGVLGGLLIALILGAVGFFIGVLVFNWLAGVFQGKPNFSRAFAAFSLAVIPAWLAGIVGSLIPWIGPLISLAGVIVSLVFVYKIIPLALEVPDPKRVVHFIVSFIVVFVINLVIGSVLGLGGGMSQAPRYQSSDSHDAGSASPASGMFGQVSRQAALMASAGEDTYDPPEDGMVSQDQAEWIGDVLDKSAKAYGEEMAHLKSISEDLDKKDNLSPADMAKMYQGMGTVVSLNSIEMEVVKTGGGNWAEYQWVKNQLRAARMQRGEGSEALAHNFELVENLPEELQHNL